MGKDLSSNDEEKHKSTDDCSSIQSSAYAQDIDQVRVELLDDKPILTKLLCFYLGYTEVSHKDKIEQIRQIVYNFPFDELINHVGDKIPDEDMTAKLDVIKEANNADISKKKYEI